ncbi:DUF3261 domain-containing protein [Brevundimonas sp. FT23042]|uniref:DUF3261 domain-containing protein n=1 Tax=Brevundimonas sp. FT23042 TaxID=3393749 RepID=UPI003B58B000
MSRLILATGVCLTLMLAVAGCATTPREPSRATAGAALQARIAPDIVLTLPTPPAYPQTRTLMQAGQIRHGDRQAAFESILSLSPEEVEIVITMAGGGLRLSTIRWTAEGVLETRSPIAPDSIPVANILADIFIALWPTEAINAALPEGVTLTETADGGRQVRRGDELVSEIRPDPANPARRTSRNLAFGYEVAIVSRALD